MQCVSRAGPSRTCALRKPWPISPSTALAGYRLGAIACLNVYLHRSGRRPDAVWERFALAIPLLFGRAAALLDDPAASRRSEVIR